jgi:hypothetical protein
MSLRDQVLGRLPAYNKNLHPIVDDQTTRDIIRGILVCHEEEKGNYDKICTLFDEPTAEETGYKIWEFLKTNVHYVAENEHLQTVRTPSAIIATGKTRGADCKNYSLFTAGIIDALNRRGAGIPWAYRFAAYPSYGIIPNKALKHVFVVLYPGSGDEIWVDAVLPGFDQKKQPCYFKDKKPSMLGKLSGLGSRSGAMIGDDDDDDSGDDFTFSSAATSAASSSSDLTDNPAGDYTAANAATPTTLDNTDWIYDPSQGGYVDPNAVNDPAAEQALADAGGSSSGSFIDNLISQFTGSKSSSGGGSSGSGINLGSGSQSKTPTTTPTGTTVILPSSTSNNNTIYWIIGGVAVVAVLLIVLKKK